MTPRLHTPQPGPPSRLRTNVYVDGFNLYYGCLKGTSFRWLDLHKQFTLLLPRNTIHRIRYFTALVAPRPTDRDGPLRQQMYIRALRTIPCISVHYGQFLTKQVAVPLVGTGPNVRTTLAWRTEEKGSDVNLATLLLLDAFRDDFEVAVVVSNDSDLVLPIRVVREQFGKVVGVLNPHPKPSHAIRAAADFIRPIRRGPLSVSQFPSSFVDSKGKISKPTTW